MTIAIETNVPVPKTSNAGRNRKYPTDKMKAGASIVVAELFEAKAASHAIRLLGHQSTYRRLTDGTYRVWRTK